MIVYRQ